MCFPYVVCIMQCFLVFLHVLLVEYSFSGFLTVFQPMCPFITFENCDYML